MTRSAAKKTGLLSQIKEFFGRFSSNKTAAESENRSEEQSLERNEDAESDSEFYDAQELMLVYSRLPWCYCKSSIIN